MANTYKAWVAPAKHAPFELQTIDDGPLGDEDVQIEVENCGVCHSDLSMWANDWGMSKFPAVFGHEAIGRITAVGKNAKNLKVGQRVGVGWTAASCMGCRSCLSGDQHLCPNSTATIVNHRGGFATHVRSHWAWAIPIPESVKAADAGPLLCGGITVFNPLAMHAKSTDRVGIVGIGGLGHMAVKFAAAMGCDVVAFTSSESKFDEARGFGATSVVSSKDANAIKKLAGSIDLLLVTVNASLDWDALIGTLAPHGRMHMVGVVPEPVKFHVFSLLPKEAAISSSPTGSPVDIATMLDFAGRHAISPQTEHFPMSQINEAFKHLEAGKARYRIVLDADF